MPPPQHPEFRPQSRPAGTALENQTPLDQFQDPCGPAGATQAALPGFSAAPKASSPRTRGSTRPFYRLSEVFEVGISPLCPGDGQTVHTLTSGDTHEGRISNAGRVAWFKVEDLVADDFHKFQVSDRGNNPIDWPTMTIYESTGQVVVQNGHEASATRREDGQDGQYPTYNIDLYFMPDEDDDYYLSLDPENNDTGPSYLKRSEFQAMMNYTLDSNNGVKAVFFYDPSRYTRDLADFYIYLRKLTKAGN